MLVAFSCKRRNWCPSCVARRMADIGVHLEQCVFPEAPVRHWICSLPWGLRALLGYDRQLCAEVLAAVIAELSRSLRRRAKKALGLSSVGDALTGAVTAVQRVDALAACYSAAALGVEVSGARAGQPALRLVQGEARRPPAMRPSQTSPLQRFGGATCTASSGSMGATGSNWNGWRGTSPARPWRKNASPCVQTERCCSSSRKSGTTAIARRVLHDPQQLLRVGCGHLRRGHARHSQSSSERALGLTSC